jgi:hypothetical protein
MRVPHTSVLRVGLSIYPSNVTPKPVIPTKLCHPGQISVIPANLCHPDRSGGTSLLSLFLPKPLSSRQKPCHPDRSGGTSLLSLFLPKPLSSRLNSVIPAKSLSSRPQWRDLSSLLFSSLPPPTAIPLNTPHRGGDVFK